MALAAGACLGQPAYIAAQDITPLRYGLFSVSDLSELDHGHWEQGVEWEPQPCGAASVWGCPTCAQNNAGNAPAKVPTAGVALRQGFPFVVYGSFQCSPFGNWDRGFDRARQMLVNGEERAVEIEFASGAHTTSPSLVSASAINITPGAVVQTVTQGLAVLEAYIGANAPGQGVILGNRREITLAAANHLIEPNDAHTQLVTKLDTPVAALGGWNAQTGPNGVAAGAGQAWLYGLGSAPRILRSPIYDNPPDREHALRTTTNQFTVLSERNYVVGFDCFAVGVLVANGTNTGAVGVTIVEP